MEYVTTFLEGSLRPSDGNQILHINHRVQRADMSRYGLSHVLGRPSSFATADSFVDVKFYTAVDDAFITACGILPGPDSPKKLISMHFFRMRRLQAEIRQTLYQNPRDSPKSDQDPWFQQMSRKLDHWRQTYPQNDQGSGMSYDW